MSQRVRYFMCKNGYELAKEIQEYAEDYNCRIDSISYCHTGGYTIPSYALVIFSE